VPALEAVIITAIEPILNPVWVFLVQGERPSRWAILGGLLIVSAVTERAVRASARPAPV
jgi:drug/metabolite transporter (DMT)-like permease